MNALPKFMSFYIIIRGPLGCGKSTIAEKLSQILKAEYFAVDRVLDEHNLTADKEAGYISQRSFIKVNEIIAPEAKRILDRGKSVVFDGNFYWKSQIDDLIKQLGYNHYVFTLQAPLETCVQRDQNRDKTHGRSAAEAVYKKSTEFEYGTAVDATGSVAETIKNILAQI